MMQLMFVLVEFFKRCAYDLLRFMHKKILDLDAFG